MNIEYNLSGFHFPINRPFPSKEIAKKLRKERARFFVGSDSHSVENFQENISKVKNAYKFLGIMY